ncbi:unnamed protein product (macronuclear) [Paramecium tetraurelia]|uniref:Uncharacterized protein n=1 Tax=Paramecium tetraurelia TaxID=5888 RepID=A0D2R7_PARTE|nr:uncharacterized protein GSPATT00012842001 [Paramecium tetraurelia]CAK77334.1 unnamed protein product [Paramecium tetraurelia]|eukprot:XP_001444731.1 hypothetical protein (macronuclear) [Paramecium tetraurelia strain d4-2]
MFIPDQRNLGGRQIICNMVWNHRLSLNIMDDKSAASPIQTKMHTPRQGCYTDRQGQNKPSFFFRRIPTSNYQKYKELLYKKPLSFPKNQQQKKYDTDIKIIDWNVVEKEINKFGKEFYKINLHQFIQSFAKKMNIKKEYDFATLIEMILNSYPNIKQEDLIEIASDIIVDEL